MDDVFSRGRYATDASIYQIMPRAVVVPKTAQDVTNTIAIAREEGATVLPRGGGTSQCGQTVNDSIVIDTTKHLNRLLELDVENRTCLVEPGIVLDELNRQLKPHGLWFPVDVSTASRATIGGMAGNNSCGGRSIRYGMMRDNVLAIDAVLADGSETTFGALEQGAKLPGFVDELLKLGEREQAEIAARFPKVMRRVGGYNIDALVPNAKRSTCRRCWSVRKARSPGRTASG
jgi:FAD/FMN-containing dehydrogenase